MWPYSNDEQVWLVPSKEWTETPPKALTSETPMPPPANDLDGALPYAAGDSANDNRPFDPQTFVGK